MKVNKLFTIDAELIEELKPIKNKSKLMNELLSEYFGRGSDQEEVLKAQIARAQHKVDELTENIKEFKVKLVKIQEKHKALESKANNVPKELIKQMKLYNKLHLPSAWKKYEKECTFEEANEAWKVIWGKDWSPVGDQTW